MGPADSAERRGGITITTFSVPAARMVVECYNTARDVFDGFVKDFVREHLYSHIRDHVPSSSRQGRDALYKRLKENKELFRYEKKASSERSRLFLPSIYLERLILIRFSAPLLAVRRASVSR